jgi:CDP-glucose 4,6-dehydratase
MFTVYNGKKVLITGHTGFKGAWLSVWLHSLGAQLSGLALEPEQADGVFVRTNIGAHMNDHRGDIRDLDRVLSVFAKDAPEIVFHLAAQPLVIESYRDPVGAFAINTQGTAHVLEAIRQTPSVRAAVMVTTDKCYENREWIYGYRETDPMGGHDPYSASKGAAEIVIHSFRRSFFSKPGTPAIASARSGNVIGGGDWAANRLVPDIFRTLEAEQTLDIRSPDAVRPWQHVLDPLAGYLLLGQKLLEAQQQYAGAWNFGPLPDNVLPVRRMADAFFQRLGRGGWRDVSSPGQLHEAGLLMLDISKAIQTLGWKPKLEPERMVAMTTDWYLNFRRQDVLALCLEQIDQYQQLWK